LHIEQLFEINKINNSSFDKSFYSLCTVLFVILYALILKKCNLLHTAKLYCKVINMMQINLVLVQKAI